MKKRLLAALAAALLTLSAPAAASCYGGPCDDVILPGEGRTVVYLPSLSGEGPFTACYYQPTPCPDPYPAP